MATKEYVQDRINKAKENIEKKENLIVKMRDRIEKNKAKLQKLGFSAEYIENLDNPWKIDRSNPNWEKAFDLAYAIENAQDSINSANDALPELRKKLEGYQSEMNAIIEKENSRDIQIIIDFLEGWKERAKKFYENSVDAWIDTLREYYEEDRKFCDWLNNHFADRKNKELVKKMEEPRLTAKAVHSDYSYLDRYMSGSFHSGYYLNTELLQKDLDNEANEKYDFIIERTNNIVGQITDASDLSIGNKGDLNGIIVGTRGKARVQTIGAGGYNIQVFHYRTLINRV